MILSFLQCVTVNITTVILKTPESIMQLVVIFKLYLCGEGNLTNQTGPFECEFGCGLHSGPSV